jgi:hypothetical protein
MAEPILNSSIVVFGRGRLATVKIHALVCIDIGKRRARFTGSQASQKMVANVCFQITPSRWTSRTNAADNIFYVTPRNNVVRTSRTSRADKCPEERRTRRTSGQDTHPPSGANLTFRFALIGRRHAWEGPSGVGACG